MRSCSFAIRRMCTSNSANGGGFDVTTENPASGRIVLHVRGVGAAEAFMPEAGGHRWQRIPPTERNGRRHSSTVTVAVFSETEETAAFDERDVEYRYCIASVGAGGQNRQKNETACVAIHKPTGTQAKCEDERSQSANRRKALAELCRRVTEAQRSSSHRQQNADRSKQIGCGARGDKIRTVQLHNGIVTNHLTGKKMPAAKYLKGYVDEIQ